MEMNVGTQLYGFTVTRIRQIPGKDAQLVEMVFDKTGTELAWVKSNEANKLFSIAFKTLPEDSTGVFHILEHSVLCGSDKYPVKEPFVELMKSSMNTFLNAMTFPDKTMYPVASRNEQDFLNLTSVYLDAVFAPKILTDPNIFRQEGWHYEVQDGKLVYNGVVFNEMKGAMSGVDGVIEQAVQDILFPDTCYGYNSGGDPEVIPDLTYEQFVDSYRKNYNPTNARVFLDGNIPLERTLEMIAGYLDSYEPGTRQEIAAQTPVRSEVTVTYEAAPEEDLDSKANLVLTKIMGNWDDKNEILAAEVLCDVLAGSNDAPVKKAILAAGLGQDVTLQVMDGVYQPWLVLRIHNMKDENSAQIRELITATLKELVEKGLNKAELTASINRLAFRTKDMQEPQALIRCITALNSWLYGGDPMMYLTYDDAFDTLRQMAEGKGFEELMARLLLDESGLCVLHVIPSVTHGEELRKKEMARLAAEQADMSAEKLAQVTAEADALKAWQQTPDTLEGLATLPVLDLAQISPEPAQLDTVEETVSGVTVLRHTTGTNGIVHLNAYFALTDLSMEELAAAPFMATLLQKLPTANYSEVADLQSAVKTHLGQLEFSVEVFAKAGQVEECTPVLQAKCSVLKENLDKAEELLAEILTTTQFNHPDRIKAILLQSEMEAQQMAMMAGHRFGALCAQAGFTAMNAVNETFNGYSSVSWLHDFAKNFDERIGGFTALAQRILSGAACAARLILSVTEDDCSDLSGLVAKFPVGTPVAAAAAYQSALSNKLGIRIPAQISYACTGYHLNASGKEYNGTIRLLCNILGLSHLWNAVRVQGGAYGAGIQSGRSGGLFCYSYRDPSPARTLGVYRTLADFIRAFKDSGEELDKFIISTIAHTEPLVSPKHQGAMADMQWFAGLTYADAVQERRELLDASWDDLLAWCGVLEDMAQNSGICVVGHAGALEACADEGLTLVDI